MVYPSMMLQTHVAPPLRRGGRPSVEFTGDPLQAKGKSEEKSKRAQIKQKRLFVLKVHRGPPSLEALKEVLIYTSGKSKYVFLLASSSQLACSTNLLDSRH